VEKHIVYISVGSNIGNKMDYCRKGIVELTRNNISKLIKISNFYLTEPVGLTDQDWFLNSVVKIATHLEPEDLFHLMKQIEIQIGRKENSIRYGPRILDLDILLYNDRIVDTPMLKIPHPEMHKRRFVLKPFCDIDRDKVHPILNRDMAYLLNTLDDRGQKVIPFKCDY
jgi:2-amino-4-hydroxy-6-hydroxymethyldihydropteridine diphosphokinase